MSSPARSTAICSPPLDASGALDGECGSSPVDSPVSRSGDAPIANPMGRVHSFESAGTLDGPGVRFVVFTSGCPLKCQYCHNPDTRSGKAGMDMSASDVLAEIAKVKNYIKSGGVTVSGGEPMQQPDFTHAILKGAKKMGLHTALDTSGFLGRKADDEFLKSVDLVLLDFKSGDEDTYRRVTGQRLQPTLDFARRLEALNIPIWARFVLVPGLTDAPDNIRNVAKIMGGLSNIDRAEILPFHKMGESKWAQLGMSYTLSDTPPPTAKSIDAARQIFKDTAGLIL